MNQGGGTLKTLSLTKIDKKQRWVETVIDLDKIICVQEYPFDTCPNTSLLSYSGEYAIHVDVPLKQMRKILDEHKRNPLKNFDTHCEVEEVLWKIIFLQPFLE